MVSISLVVNSVLLTEVMPRRLCYTQAELEWTIIIDFQFHLLYLKIIITTRHTDILSVNLTMNKVSTNCSLNI